MDIPVLFLISGGKAFSFFPLILAVGFSCMAFMMLRYVPSILTFLRAFIYRKKNLMFILERETERKQREEQREKETQNLKQAPCSELSAQNPMQDLNP